MCCGELEHAPSTAGAAFPSTHWSVVLAAGRSDCPDASRALAELCCTYWYPLYAYVRRHGHDAPDAQDLTQEFFARLLEKRFLDLADPQRGRFRSFLLAALKHFLINEWDRSRTAKRGGRRGRVPFDVRLAEERYQSELADELTPERAYERRWAVALLERAQARLAKDYAAAGRSAQCEVLREFLWGTSGPAPYARTAVQLGLTESGVRTAVRRLRARYREILRCEIAQTVAGPEQLEEEIRWLFSTFS